MHHTDSGYDPVLDGVGRGLEDLFPPIHDPPPIEQDEGVVEPACDQDDENADVA